MFVTYKLTEKSLIKLKKKGFSESVIGDLRQLENKIFSNQDNFKVSLRKLSYGSEILDEIADYNKPVVFVSGHFANFELMSMEITKKTPK